MSTEEGRQWAALGQCVRHIAEMAQEPAHEGDGDAECYGCRKLWGHHNRGEVGTVCIRHDYGPSCHPDLTAPGEMNRGARVFNITTRRTDDREWEASDDFYRLSCDGAETEDEAIDFVVGAIYAALVERGSPPRSVRFRVKKARPCDSCFGRGWFVGDCHPREECGACKGKGYIA